MMDGLPRKPDVINGIILFFRVGMISFQDLGPFEELQGVLYLQQ